MDVKKWLVRSGIIFIGGLLFGVITLGLINTERMEAANKSKQHPKTKSFPTLQTAEKQEPYYRSSDPSSRVIHQPATTPISSPTINSAIRPVAKTAEGTPIFTNESFPQQKRPSGNWNVYRQLKDTCTTWTNRYRKDGSERNRVNMNQSCRYAASYAVNELNINPGPVNHAAYKSKTVNSPVVAFTGSSGSSSSSQCSVWKQEKERIQNQLRSGYREPTGNRLRERKRELSDLIYGRC